MVNLFFFLLYLDSVLVYFPATLGLGRTGWEMQLTDSEEMEKKKKIKSCAFSLVVDFDGY